MRESQSAHGKSSTAKADARSDMEQTVSSKGYPGSSGAKKKKQEWQALDLGHGQKDVDPQLSKDGSPSKICSKEVDQAYSLCAPTQTAIQEAEAQEISSKERTEAEAQAASAEAEAVAKVLAEEASEESFFSSSVVVINSA